MGQAYSVAPAQLEPESCVAVLPFLDDLTKHNLQKLIRTCERQEYQEGEEVVSSGLPAGFNVIIGGIVELKSEQQEILRTLHSGQWFGELALNADFDLESITAIAKERTTILRLTNEQFRALAEEEPEIGVCLSPISDGSIRVRLRSVTFLQGLDERMLQQLSWLFEFQRCAEGAVVCRQSDESNGFYIVVKGHCSVSVFSEETQTNVHLGSLNPGDWFGEISLIELTKRTADVIALSDCVFLFISRDHFQKFEKLQKKYNDTATPFFDEIIKKRTAASLKAVPLFSVLITKEIGPVRRFDEEKLALLGNLFKFVEYKENDVVYKQGDPSDAMYVIISGSASISVIIGDKEEECLTMNNSDCFGEAGLFTHTPRTTKCTASSDLVCLKLLRENFESFLKVAPAIQRDVEHLVVKRTGDLLDKIPFFSGLKENKPWSKISLLGSIFQFEFFRANDKIFEEGQLGDKFYVIVTGTVEASTYVDNDKHIFCEMGPDQFFGEMALIHRTTRSATVTCKEDCILLTLTNDNYDKFRQIAPELQGKIKRLVEARTANTLKTIPLFRSVRENKPWSKLDILAAMFIFEQKSTGDEITKQGSAAEKFYVILSGAVEVLTEDTSKKTLSAGDYFGEVALLDMDKSCDQVTAIEDSLLISLTNTQFEQFLQISPESLSSLKANMT